MWYGKGKWIHYAEVCTWYGALRYAEITGDKQLAGQLKDRFDLLVTMEKSHLPIMDHVDLNVFGCIPLESYFYKIMQFLHPSASPIVLKDILLAYLSFHP